MAVQLYSSRAVEAAQTLIESAMKAQGLTQDKIVNRIAEMGESVSLATVGNIINARNEKFAFVNLALILKTLGIDIAAHLLALAAGFGGRPGPWEEWAHSISGAQQLRMAQTLYRNVDSIQTLLMMLAALGALRSRDDVDEAFATFVSRMPRKE